MKTILSIAGSDNMGGAGIQADLRAANCLGVHCLTAVTAVTAQNSSGIKAVECLDPAILRAQLDSICEEVSPDVIKIGMVGSLKNGEVILDFLKSLNKESWIVIDPVVKATAGGALSGEKEFDSYKWRDLYLEIMRSGKTIITPNSREALWLINSDSIEGNVISEELNSLKAIISELLNLSPFAAILTGITYKKNPEIITDYLGMGENMETLVLYESTHSRFDTINLHGTGCTFSSLLASYLALGEPILEAFRKTSLKLEKIIKESGSNYCLGKSDYGPLNIFENYKF